MKFKQFLNLPFDILKTPKEKWVYIISSILFILFFLFVYQPFGFYKVLEDKEHSTLEFIGILSLFMSIIFIILSVSQFILRKRFLVNNYTIKDFLKWFFIDISLIVIVITVLKFFVIEEDTITIQSFVSEVLIGAINAFLVLTFILLYPVFGNFTLRYLQRLNNEKKELEEDLNVINNHYKIASGNDDLIKLVDENKTCKLTVPINNIYAIESQNQYISVKYFKSDRIFEQCIRTRFSKILEAFDNSPSIIKCHRSYAVNLLNVVELKTINQKPNLILGTHEVIKIPVSKTYIKEVKTKLSQY